MQRNRILSVFAVLAVGVLLGAGLYLRLHTPQCFPSPIANATPLVCTPEYSIYRLGIRLDRAFAQLTSSPALATYVVYPPYADSALKVPHGKIIGNLYFVVFPERNEARFVSLWSEGNVTYEAVSQGNVESGVVPSIPDLQFCHSVISELNVPLRYYRFYVSSDRNGEMEFCSLRPAMEFNAFAATLSSVFKPTFEISGNLLYEVPDLNAAATLYRKPVTILEVYRRARPR